VLTTWPPSRQTRNGRQRGACIAADRRRSKIRTKPAKRRSMGKQASLGNRLVAHQPVIRTVPLTAAICRRTKSAIGGRRADGAHFSTYSNWRGRQQEPHHRALSTGGRETGCAGELRSALREQVRRDAFAHHRFGGHAAMSFSSVSLSDLELVGKQTTIWSRLRPASTCRERLRWCRCRCSLHAARQKHTAAVADMLDRGVRPPAQTFRGRLGLSLRTFLEVYARDAACPIAR